MTRNHGFLDAARAAALFTSDLSSSSQPTRSEITDAVRCAVRFRGGTRGCVVLLAGEYGDHPESAVPRMRWARSVVDRAFRATDSSCRDQLTPAIH
jgi:hypothetical protein